MAPPSRPAGAVALRVLREVTGRGQAEVAGACGLHPDTVIGYEKTGRIPEESLRKLLAELGFTRADYSDAIEFVEDFQTRLGWPRGAEADPGDEGERRLRRLAARLGREEAQVYLEHRRHWQQEVEVAEGRAAGVRLWKRLRKHLGLEVRRRLVEANREFWQWGLAVEVSHRSREAAARDVREALELGELAVFVAERVDEPGFFPQQVQAYSLAFFANALRVKGELRLAVRTSERGERQWDFERDPGSGALDAAQVWSLKASLLREKRRFPEALALIERALEGKVGAEREPLLVKKVSVQHIAGDHVGLIATCNEVLPLLEESGQSHLEFLTKTNLLGSLIEVGGYVEARALLPEAHRLANQNKSRPAILRFRWMEGTLNVHSGQAERGLLQLAAVRDEFAQYKIFYDVALVTLEMSVYYLQQGNPHPVKRLANQLAHFFKSEGGHQEALAAVQLFYQAAAAETLTLQEAQRLFKFLKEARHNPELHLAAWQG
jgi:hypothetical protein